MVGIQILCHACHASKKIWKDTQYEYDTPMQDLGCEKTLEDTAQSALNQIEQKCYDAELQDMGIPKEHITHYGFAFAGKNVLIAGQRGKSWKH